jgi:Methyltransferase domain
LKNTLDAGYGPAPANGFVARILQSQRGRLSDAFAAFSGASPEGKILHVGLAPSSIATTENDSAWTETDRNRVTRYLIDPPDAMTRHTQARAPSGERHAHHDAVHLPYADGQFDWAYGDEVIEHVGSFERQYALVKELARVSRRGVFVTASNRRHPIEFHTALPFLHWLPDAWWRRLLKLLGKNAWASESTLNLVDSSVLYKIAMLLPGKPKHDVGHKRVFGIKAHFFLMIEKGADAEKKAAKTAA